MNNIYTVVPCRTYKATATQACTLTDGHGLTLQLEPGTPAIFEAKTSELHATAFITLAPAPSGGGGGGGIYVTFEAVVFKKHPDMPCYIKTDGATWNGLSYEIMEQCVLDELSYKGGQYACVEPCVTAVNGTYVLNGIKITILAGELEEDVIMALSGFANAIENANSSYALKIKKIYHD